MQATGFLPSRDGFSFRNDFDYPASRLGRAAPLAPGFGLAAGMCLAALDRWQAGRPLPVLAAAPAPGEVLYEELIRRQVELLSHGGWDAILDWQRRPGMGSLLGPRGVGELTRAEWGRLRRSLERGMPALLCVMRTRGPFANPSENPIVLAYRYEYARETKRGTIWVYDPNRPGNDDVLMTIVTGSRRRAPEVTFIAERVRGFMVMPHDRPVASPFRAVELATDAETGGFTGRAVALPGRGANLAVRARNGGVVLVRGGKSADGSPNLQRSGAESVLASDPLVIPGALPTLVARDVDGNLLGLRVGVRGWRPRLLPSPKAPLAIDSGPVMVTNRGRVHVFGIQKGRLAHLQRSRAGKWTAGVVPGQSNPAAAEALEGMPTAIVGPDHVLRVFARTAKGRIALMMLSKEGQWTTQLLPAAETTIAGDPIAVIASGDRQVTVFAVSENGELIQTRGGGSDAWRVRNLTKETARDTEPSAIRVEIAVSAGPGNTLHVFGVSPRRGLIHYWCPPTLAWRSQDLTHGRAETGESALVRGRPTVVRTADDQLVVAAAADKGLVVYRWSPAGDWTGDMLPLPPSIAARASFDGPVLWRDARGAPHLLAVLDDGSAVLGVPGRPDAEHRAIRMGAVAAIQPPRPLAPTPGTAEAALEPPSAEPDAPIDVPLGVLIGTEAAALPVGSVADADVATLEPMDLPGSMLPLANELLDTSTAFESIDATDATLAEVQAMDDGASPGIELIDLGGLADADPEPAQPDAEPTLDIGFGSLDLESKPKPAGATPFAPRDERRDREGWGSYVDSTTGADDTMDLGAFAFEPAEALVPGSAPRSRLDLPEDPTLGANAMLDAAVVDTDVAERERVAAEQAAAEAAAQQAAAEKAERERVAAEQAAAEAAERARVAAEQAAAEAAERARVAAEKAAAEKAERERIAAEKAAAEKAERERIAAEKAAAEEAERQRIAAEKAAAEEAERERIAAEKAAAEEAERERLAAEKAAAEEAERQRIAAEKAAAEKAERERLAVEKAAAEEAERERIAAEKAAAEEAERERIAAEKAAAEEAERQRIAAEEAERERVAAEQAAAERAAAEEAERQRIAAEKAEAEEVAAKEKERKRAGADREAARLAAEQEARRREEERRAKKAEAERARAKEPKGKQGRKGQPAKPDKRPIPAALEGLPLLDDEIRPREPRAESAKPEEPKPAQGGKKPKLRSIDDLIRLSDEHGPTFEKK